MIVESLCFVISVRNRKVTKISWNFAIWHGETYLFWITANLWEQKNRDAGKSAADGSRQKQKTSDQWPRERRPQTGPNKLGFQQTSYNQIRRKQVISSRDEAWTIQSLERKRRRRRRKNHFYEKATGGVKCQLQVKSHWQT